MQVIQQSSSNQVYAHRSPYSKRAIWMSENNLNTDQAWHEMAWEMPSWVKEQDTDYRYLDITIPAGALLSSSSYSRSLSDKHPLIKRENTKLQFRHPVTKGKKSRGMSER